MATNRIDYTQNNRSVAELLAGFRDELKDFFSTRIQMLRTEMSEKVSTWKVATPSLVIGAVFLAVSFLVFTGFLIAIIGMAFADRSYAYPVAFAIVFVLYALVGGVALMYGIRTLREAGGVTPERTMRMLKEDQVWLQTEARTQL